MTPKAGEPTSQAKSSAVTRVRTDHLEIRTRVSGASIVPGVAWALVLDITPRQRMHVYAPGAVGYRVIELAMTPMRGVTFQPAQFPPAEIYEFVPLNEHVPVYQKPFQLIQPLTIEASSKNAAPPVDGDTLTIKAALNYQACDDRLCFPPVSVPLSWTVPIKPGGV